MKKVILAICVCILALTMVSSAMAEELWDWHLQGADEGLAYGALPPPGLYFINDFYWAGNAHIYNQDGTADALAKLEAYVNVPILLWNPGICPILGATYACGIAQPFDMTNIRVAGVDPAAPELALTGTQWGAYQTILIPFILSWEVPCNLHVAASLAIGLNDATTSPGDSYAATAAGYNQGPGNVVVSKDLRNVYAWSGSNNYTFTPSIGISWLYGGWNISAEFQYTMWTKDTDCNYQNGDELYSEYTATYTCGKWTFGMGAANNKQVYADKYDGVNIHKMAMNWTAGPILGYNFGPCSLLFVYNFRISTRADVGGDFCMMRLVVPLGNPYNWYK